MKQVKNQIWTHIKEKIKNSAWINTYGQFDDITWKQLRNQFINKLGHQVWVKVRNQIRDQF